MLFLFLRVPVLISVGQACLRTGGFKKVTGLLATIEQAVDGNAVGLVGAVVVLKVIVQTMSWPEPMAEAAWPLYEAKGAGPEELCRQYRDEELALILGFLRGQRLGSRDDHSSARNDSRRWTERGSREPGGWRLGRDPEPCLTWRLWLLGMMERHAQRVVRSHRNRRGGAHSKGSPCSDPVLAVSVAPSSPSSCPRCCSSALSILRPSPRTPCRPHCQST